MAGRAGVGERLQTKLEILLPQEEILYFALHFKSKHITQLDEITSEEIEQVEKTLYDIYRMLQKRFGRDCDQQGSV